MRLFVAVSPPEPARAHLTAALASTEGPGPAPRWTPAARMHLTLAFLGEVDGSCVPALLDSLPVALAGRRAPVLQLRSAGTFGSRVLWADLAGELPALTALAGRVRTACRSAGVDVEQGGFRAHLTLARARRGEDLRPWAVALRTYAGPTWAADRVALVRSSPADGYVDVAAWPLRTQVPPAPCG